MQSFTTLLLAAATLLPAAEAQEVVLTNAPTYEFTAPYTRLLKIDVDYPSFDDEIGEPVVVLGPLDLSTHQPVEGAWIWQTPVQHDAAIIHRWTTIRPLAPGHRYQVGLIGGVVRTTNYTVRITRMP